MAESSFSPPPARVFHFLPIYMQSSRNNARLFKNLKTPSVWAMSVSERGRTRLPTEGKHSQEPAGGGGGSTQAGKEAGEDDPQTRMIGMFANAQPH